MKKILIIIIFQLTIQSINAQELIEYKFVLNEKIGMSTVPIQGALVEINSLSELYTNNAGEFSVKLNVEELRIKIHYPGYRKIDTILYASKLNALTELNIVSECTEYRDLALSDISKNEIKLLLVGGAAPSIVLGQERIEDKFNFKYKNFGCSHPTHECIKVYNFFVFNFLDDKYGKSWRKSIRNDVIGLKEYKMRVDAE